ncbi:MFS transporter [Xanthomonas sp. NCPPB 2654]|uniref:MFS transporter n=1 Tax=unclassified Xanthomonas TaxID=2643310 RepID=UPI0021E05F26|nr:MULTISPECIES: MFS transporter [unclassified Xanthomonas]MDL5364310.1 MFS transporter [Xanthomonas sp. NCPPB 2654]UYC20395.1 MFS transporter [Xanthomonas sp. CFBP 8443]
MPTVSDSELKPEPPRLSRAQVALFACASGASVANVYFAQPLLDALAAEFGIGQGAAGGVIGATQAGCALALLLVVPLGDRHARRPLMLWQGGALLAALLAVAAAPTLPALLAGMLALGLLGTAMTQGLIAYAAASAAAAERGRVVGAAQAGVVIGLLLARVLAGVIADLAGWRGVYAASAALTLVLLLWLRHALPALPAPQRPPGYAALLRSMLRMLAHERVLQIRGGIALLMFASFSIFWTALVLPLSAAPYAYSHATIGAFGLVGAVGALAAARAGRWADRGWAQRCSGLMLALLLASWLPLALGMRSLAALVLGIVVLDMAGQAIHVINQSLIFRGDTSAHSRRVAGYMLFYALGSGLGAIAATATYAHAGWTGVCILGAATSAAALLFWATTLRWMPATSAR